jgi:hypothetical protein
MVLIRVNAECDIELISCKPFANSDSVAGVVKLVDARDSKSRSERSVGSIPTARTILANEKQRFKFAKETNPNGIYAALISLLKLATVRSAYHRKWQILDWRLSLKLPTLNST